MAADRSTTSNIRLLDPNVISPAFTQFQQGKNFYFFPDQLSIDRYEVKAAARLRGGCARTQPVAADRQPARLDQPAHRLHHPVHRLPGQYRGIANDPNAKPEFLASVVGANGSVISPGPAPLTSRASTTAR